MGGSKTNKQNQANQTQNNAYQTQFENEQQQRSKEAYDRSNTAWGGANDTYQNFAKGGGKELLDGMGNYQAGGDGGAAGDPRFGEVEGSYRNFMNTGGVDTGRFNQFQGNLLDIGATGGWDQAARDNVNRSIAGYQNFADTGGVSAEDQNRMRGMGIYDEWSKTGGVSDADKANIRARGNSVIPAFYNRVREESNRLGRVQGGGGPGQAALMSRLARDQSRGAQSAALQTEGGLADTIRLGQKWGTEGMERSEAGLQELLSKNKLAGMGGVADATGLMANSIAQNRTAASAAGGGNEIGMQGLISGNKLQGTRGLEGMAESSAARGAASSNAAAADARWRASFLADNMLAGAGGLRGLRTDVPGEVALYDQNRLNSRQIWNQGNQINQQPQGGGTDWGQVAGAGANAAATYFGGQTGNTGVNGRPRNPYGYDQAEGYYGPG